MTKKTIIKTANQLKRLLPVRLKAAIKNHVISTGSSIDVNALMRENRNLEAKMGELLKDRQNENSERVDISRKIALACNNLPLNHPSTLEIARLSHSLHPHNMSETVLFKATEGSGDLSCSQELLNNLLGRLIEEKRDYNEGLIRTLKRTSTYQLRILDEIPFKSQQMRFRPVPGRVLYILNNSLPHSSNGYATRSHGVATGLQGAGIDLITFTRPGYPWDWGEVKSAPMRDQVDSIAYNRIRQPSLRDPGTHDYFTLAAAAIEQTILLQKPSVVMAASNYRNALPALIASRRLGVPFVYEVRGFWEITRGSRQPDFFETAEFKAQEMLETATAQGADMVLTLNEGMRQKLGERGVDVANVHLFPNSFNPTHFSELNRDSALAASLGIPDDVPVIGYVGSFVDYEGLDDLVAAAALMKRKGHNFRLLIVGSEQSTSGETPISDMMRQTAEASGLADWLIMPGRVSFETVSAYYSLIDICPFPRKPWPVCELVSPIKPVEAMAMGKPLVLPNLAALAGFGKDGETTLIYEKGDVRSLSHTLEKLVADRDLRNQMGKAGQLWAQKNMTWEATSAKVAPLIHSLCKLEPA